MVHVFMRGLVTPSLHQGNSQDLLRKKWYTVPRFVYIDATVARVRATNYETMKTKALLLTLMAMIGLSVSAQPRIAVLDFNAGVQVSQNDVDGLSAIFNTYFEPAGYIVVERTRVSRILEEQNMQGGRLTEKEMVKLSEILNVPVIVIGDVNKAMGQYNIDVRAVNVETGAILAKDGAEWAEGTSYRSMMRALAERLSKDIPMVEFKRPEPKPETKKKTIDPTYRPTGGYLRISSGYPVVGSLAYNHQITPYFMVGGGAGFSPWAKLYEYDYYGGRDYFDELAIQIYAETELRTPKYNWSLFLNLKLGTTIPIIMYADPIFVAIHAGVSYENLHLGVGFSTSSYIGFSGFLSYSLPLKLLL